MHISEIDPFADFAQSSSSGLYLPADFKARPIAIDLFSGAGGMTLGFLQAGWEVLAGVENEPCAAVTYLANLGTYPMEITFITPEDRDRLDKYIEADFKRKRKKGQLITDFTTTGCARPPDRLPVRNFFFGDIRKLSGEQICERLNIKPGDLDCVAGGPPCQGYSTSGKRQIMDPRNSLVFEFTRLVRELRPRTLVFENVPGIVGMQTPEGISIVDAICMDLAKGSWGSYDAIRRALVGSTARAAVRDSKKPVKKAVQRVPDTRKRAKRNEAAA